MQHQVLGVVIRLFFPGLMAIANDYLLFAQSSIIFDYRDWVSSLPEIGIAKKDAHLAVAVSLLKRKAYLLRDAMSMEKSIAMLKEDGQLKQAQLGEKVVQQIKEHYQTQR